MHIFHNNFKRHHTEMPLVNGHNRTVATEMLTSSACLYEAHDFASTIWKL